MKLPRNIKKLLGIIYVSLFSFALSVTTTKTINKVVYAADSVLEELTWTWQSGGYNYYTATYSDGNDYCVYAATPDTASYDRSEETLSVTCTISVNEGNDPNNAYNQEIVFEYAVTSALDEDGTYYFTGTRDGNTESIELESSIVATTGNPSSQDDEYWFTESGDVYYHHEDGSDTGYDYYSIEYHVNYSYVALDLTEKFDANTHQSLTVTDVTFNPEPEEDGSYTGTLECLLPGDEEYVELSFSGITLTIDNSSQQSGDPDWSYDSGYLSYSPATVQVSEIKQNSVIQTGADTFTITYDIYLVGDNSPSSTKTVYATSASYDSTVGGEFGAITGIFDVIGNQNAVTLYVDVEPQLLGGTQDDYEEGWNYIEDDFTLVYWDSEHPDAGYELAWVKFFQYDCHAEICFAGIITGGTDTVACHIQQCAAVFGGDLVTLTGYMEILNTSTWEWELTNQYVELHFDMQYVSECYLAGWNYSRSYDQFIYYVEYDETLEGPKIYNDVTPSDPWFHEAEDPAEQYLEINYEVTLDGEDQPTSEYFSIYEASYTHLQDGYVITGKYDVDYNGETYTFPVTVSVSDMTITQEFVPGFHYDLENHILTYWEDEETEYRAVINYVVWNYFGQTSELNEIYIDYLIKELDEDLTIDEKTVCIKGGVFTSEPGEQNNEGYLQGDFQGEQIVLVSPRLDNKNEISNGFNYLEGMSNLSDYDYDLLIYYDLEDDARYSVAVTTIYYNVGKEQLQVYSNSISEENVSTLNEVFILTSPNIIQTQTQQQNGIVQGYWSRLGKTITLVTPILTYTNDAGNGWHYESSELNYYDALYTEDYVSFDFSFATFNVDDQELEIQYEIDFYTATNGETSNTYEAIHISNPQFTENNLGDGKTYTVTGACRELNATVTLTIPEYYVNSTGWHYDVSDGLYYNDSTYGGVPHEFYDASYYPDRGYIVITYTLGYYEVTNAEIDDTQEDLVITNPSFEEEDLQTTVFYKVTGYCEELDQNIKVEIPYYSTLRTGWEYNNDGLFYTDEEYGEIDIGVSSVDYYEDTKTVLVTYNLFYSVTSEGEVADKTAVFTITNASVEELEDSGKTYYLITGYSQDVNSEVELEYSILNYMNPSWVYDNRGDMYIDLYWKDPSHQDYETIISSANYNEEFKTVNIVYGIYTYELNTGDGSPTGDGPSIEKPELVMEKVVHMTEVQKPYTITKQENPEFEETMVFVRGTNTDVPEATLLSIPESKFNTIYYDPDAGTITDDQQIDIKELLPEETSVDEGRMNDSVEAISSATAHEIIVTVNDAHEENDAKLASGEITPEKHAENKQIIETVTEASVVVGAVATTASDEGKAVDNALPEDNELGFTMDETLVEFLQLQMDYLLGKRKAPGEDDSTKGILRVGEPITNSGSINLNISAAEYGKMIDFVDTAVSNMKDAALQIRKCSASKMKKVVGDYIQVVKVSSFREFDATAAENEFVDAVYKAIMLNMQQQVIEALKRDHKPTNNPEKELLYRQQLEACEEFDTFEELVLEVLRQKYNSISNAAEVGIDEFRDTYRLIFRSWALNKPEENPTSITLEQLTTATIETTKANANRFEYRGSFNNKESLVFIIFGAVAVLGIASAIAVPILVGKSKQKRA